MRRLDRRSRAASNCRTGPRSIGHNKSKIPSTLNQGAVSIEERLRIVACPVVAFVDSHGNHRHSGALVGFANCVGRIGWHGYGLVEQFRMLLARSDFVRCLNRRKNRDSVSGKVSASLLPISAAASALLLAPFRRLGCRGGIMVVQFYCRFDMFGELHGTIAIGGETSE